jgi:hypothetical protein
MIYDYINGAFELVGGVATWANFVQLRRDRAIAGVHWASQGFFASWSAWNLIYYPSLHQWASTVGGVALASGNIAWLGLAVKLKSQLFLANVQAVRNRIFGGPQKTEQSGPADSNTTSTGH